MPFLFPPGRCAAAVVGRLAAHGWRGQIVGPHGSGKSTLLAALDGLLAAAGRNSYRVTLHDRQRGLPRGWLGDACQSRANLIVVDGYEQLRPWARYWLDWHCRWRGWGLLITAHRDQGLPTIFETDTTEPLALELVSTLCAPQFQRFSDSDLVRRRYRQANGNLREMLFALFDDFERTDGRLCI